MDQRENPSTQDSPAALFAFNRFFSEPPFIPKRTAAGRPLGFEKPLPPGLAGQDVAEEAEGVVERFVVNVPVQVSDLRRNRRAQRSELSAKRCAGETGEWVSLFALW